MYVAVDDIETFGKKVKNLTNQLKNVEIKQFEPEQEEVIEINSLEDVKSWVEKYDLIPTDVVTPSGSSLLLVACQQSSNTEVIDYLMHKTLDKTTLGNTNYHGYNPIMMLAWNKCLSDDEKIGLIQQFLDAGVDINAVTKNCETALSLAISNLNIDLASYLIAHHACLYRELTEPEN